MNGPKCVIILVAPSRRKYYLEICIKYQPTLHKWAKCVVFYRNMIIDTTNIIDVDIDGNGGCQFLNLV